MISSTKKQSGAVLVIALVLLSVLTIIGVSSMSGSTLQLKVARSAQQHNIAFQATQSVIDFVITNTPNKPNSTATPIDYLMVLPYPFDPVLNNPVITCNSGGICPTDAKWSVRSTIDYSGCGKGVGSSLESGKAFDYRFFDIAAEGQTTTGSSYSTQSQGIQYPVASC